jgi:hypothetical protein
MERTSFDEIAELLAAEIDGTLIDERLAMTPTERLDAMQRVLRFISEARGDDRSARPARRAR